jgi:hypothetical protein
MSLYRSLIALLASLSADPAEIDREPPRSAAAVAAAYATMASEGDSPAPKPKPSSCGCGGKCSSGVYRPDGRIEMRCTSGCSCGCTAEIGRE